MAEIISCIYPSGYTLTSAENTRYGERKYTTCALWEAGESSDLVSAGNTHLCEIIGGASWDGAHDTSNVVIDWNTDATHYITIVALGLAKCGIIRDKGYKIEGDANYGYTFHLDSNYTRVSYIGVKNTSNHAREAFRVDGTGCIFNSCVAYDTVYINGGRGFSQDAGTNYYINCVGYGCFYNFSVEGGIGYCYNCVSMNAEIYGFTNWGTLVGKNCYAGGSGTDDFVRSMTLTTCASEDGTRSTTVIAFSTSSGAYFTNVTGGSENATIGASSELINIGTDLHADATYPFNWDYVGDTRPDGAWDIGADEYVAAGGRVTFNTRPNHLGEQIGMGFGMNLN